MRCAECRTPMPSTPSPSDPRVTVHACACGRAWSTRDVGYVPSGGTYSPSGALPVVADVFRLLPEEEGWSQEDGGTFDAGVPVRVMTKTCRDCAAPFKPNNAVQVRCTACAVAVRKVGTSARYEYRTGRPRLKVAS